MQNVPEEPREGRDGRMGETLVRRTEDSECTGEELKREWAKNPVRGGEEGDRETLMMELTKMVQ